MPVATIHESIDGLTLDQVMFDTPFPFKERLLEQVIRTKKPITLKAVGGTVPIRLKGWSIDLAEGEEATYIPEMAIQLLDMYGREGRYQGRDQATGYRPSSFNSLPKEVKEELKDKVTFLNAHLAHAATF